MKCRRIRHDIEEALTAGTPFEASLAEHLAACQQCRIYAVEAAKSDALIAAAARRAEPRPPEGLHDRIMQRLACEQRPRQQVARRFGSRQVAAALLAAVAVLLMAVAFRAMHSPSPHSDVVPQTQPPLDVASLASVTENFRALDPRHVARETARPFRELAMAITATVTSPFQTIQPDNSTAP
jgi:predicted anti-sigma-YlaC factor YlaD